MSNSSSLSLSLFPSLSLSCGKVCEEGLPKVKLEQEGEESWKESAKKVAGE